MESLKELADMFIWIIRAGTITRVAYCFLKITVNDEEMAIYKKRIQNVIIFHILAESVWVLKDLISYYFT